MNTEQFLEKANRCLQTASINLEANDPDAACNRAYYAMHNAARGALFAARQRELSRAKTHSGVISAFSEHLVKTGQIDQIYSRSLAIESNRRQLSDYEGDAISAEAAKESITSATAFVAAITCWIEAQQQQQ